MSLGYHANDPHLQSPLLCLNWWRICLDQPQSFNSNTEKVYEMASCLKSVHKWVMPGASIQESSKSKCYLLFIFTTVITQNMNVYVPNLF